MKNLFSKGLRSRLCAMGIDENSVPEDCYMIVDENGYLLMTRGRDLLKRLGRIDDHVIKLGPFFVLKGELECALKKTRRGLNILGDIFDQISLKENQALPDSLQQPAVPP